MKPVRALMVPFAATLKLNDPSPDMPPLVIVIHATVLAGVHAQELPVVTAMLLLSPVDSAETLVGDTLYVQLSAACVTVTVWPPTVMVPVRALAVPFAATVKLNEPSPDIPGLVMVIQGTVLEGVHVQFEPVVTPILLLRPVEGADTDMGDTL
jgi:hypothetical protein